MNIQHLNVSFETSQTYKKLIPVCHEEIKGILRVYIFSKDKAHISLDNNQVPSQMMIYPIFKRQH